MSYLRVGSSRTKRSAGIGCWKVHADLITAVALDIAALRQMICYLNSQTGHPARTAKVGSGTRAWIVESDSRFGDVRAEATRRRWVPRLSVEIARAERFTARGRVVGVAFSRPWKSICHHIPMCVPGSVLYRVNYFFKNTTISRHTYGDLVTQFM